MMIREAKQEDIDSIIVLLQASLGESLLKKSAEIWNFKHVINPFGESTVLLAEEASTLIGVRAFMQWRWQLNNQIWTSYRAVDTATHPNHQGKGIFKKLTLQAIEEIKQKGDCFVFNTPNDQSRPGYLKMGWQKVGKVRVAVVPTFFYGLQFLFSKKRNGNSINSQQLETLCENHNLSMVQKNILFTPKSPQYLKWRYEENPMQDYFVVSTSAYYIVMYVKKHRYFNELRVVETIGSFDVKIHSSIKKVVLQYAIRKRCLFITTAERNLFSFRLYGGFGPVLTFRSVSSSERFNNIALNIDNWGYCLGDLELF